MCFLPASLRVQVLYLSRAVEKEYKVAIRGALCASIALLESTVEDEEGDVREARLAELSEDDRKTVAGGAPAVIFFENYFHRVAARDGI